MATIGSQRPATSGLRPAASALCGQRPEPRVQSPVPKHLGGYGEGGRAAVVQGIPTRLNQATPQARHRVSLIMGHTRSLHALLGPGAGMDREQSATEDHGLTEIPRPQ